jgi:hypothetical protein
MALAVLVIAIATDGGLVYNRGMDTAPQAQSDSAHDDTLIDWLLSLTPAERLAELESRLAFFNRALRDGDIELPPNTRAA